jgi:hypothetical protein
MLIFGAAENTRSRFIVCLIDCLPKALSHWLDSPIATSYEYPRWDERSTLLSCPTGGRIVEPHARDYCCRAASSIRSAQRARHAEPGGAARVLGTNSNTRRADTSLSMDQRLASMRLRKTVIVGASQPGRMRRKWDSAVA